jgi:hypothetical protein
MVVGTAADDMHATTESRNRDLILNHLQISVLIGEYFRHYSIWQALVNIDSFETSEESSIF